MIVFKFIMQNGTSFEFPFPAQAMDSFIKDIHEAMTGIGTSMDETGKPTQALVSMIRCENVLLNGKTMPLRTVIFCKHPEPMQAA
jgi:hypothetical protein